MSSGNKVLVYLGEIEVLWFYYLFIKWKSMQVIDRTNSTFSEKSF